jgi:hypothetical protein
MVLTVLQIQGRENHNKCEGLMKFEKTGGNYKCWIFFLVVILGT